MNATERFWAGDFGNQYTARNRVEWSKRIPFWHSLLGITRPRSVLEVGSNAGWNLLAIRSVDATLRLKGVDVNQGAVSEAAEAGLDVEVLNGEDVGRKWPYGFDLVMTVGVLIHVHPEQLSTVMSSIALASCGCVLAVEYAADKEEPVNYRGHEERLWRRPFGRLYEEMGLKLIGSGPLRADSGFDNCTWWLLRK